MVRLLTLGTLSWTAPAFGREKPLLLLAYLALNGTQLRRDAARRFWPDAANPMNSLSVALGQLRKVAPDVVQASDTQVSARLTCDALEFQQAAAAHDLAAAQHLYQGAFLAGLTLDDLGEEIEEWIMQTREELAETLRGLLLHCAKAALARDPAEAGRLAAQAYHLAGAAPLTPTRLRELHALLGAAGHPDAGKVAREAAELGLKLQPGSHTLPVVALLGRQTELERLGAVQPGETLWLRGAAGLGKSALLRAAAAQGGTLLSGRSGRAFQTLLPLAPDAAPTSESTWLAWLIQNPAPLWLDDWEAADPESRRVLLALARSRAGGPLIVSSREKPPAALPEVVLRPLGKAHLIGEQWERSAGIPALLHAGTPAELADAYAGLLSSLTPRARQLLACLSVQPAPDRQATCAALDLNAETMAELLETLSRACLLEEGRPLAPAAVRAWLETQPSLETEVLTLLAPHLDGEVALPLYFRAHALTGSSDLPGFQDVLARHARRLLETGRDGEAEALLKKHALSAENRLLHGRALDALGHYPEAIKLLDSLERTPLVEAYRGRVLYRLGKVPEANAAAQEALKGDLEAKAQGYNLLGALALAGRNDLNAKACFEKATGLFLAQDDNIGHLNALCSLGLAEMHLGEDISRIIEQATRLAKKYHYAQAFLNIGFLLEKLGDLDKAVEYFKIAAHFGEEFHSHAITSYALNNIGAIYHHRGNLVEAEEVYRQAIKHARNSGEVKALAAALGNLAELLNSLPLIEETLQILRDAEQADLVAYFEGLRESFMARSGGG